MVKRKYKKAYIRRQRELRVPLWLVDGFNGILALMIYNFILYLTRLMRVGGLIGKLEDSSGYFYLNSAATFGLSKTLIILLLFAVFGLTFILGTIIGNIVRKHER